MTRKFEIDYDTADRITLLSLKDNISFLKKEMKAHKKGAYMHPEDVVYNIQVIEALKILVKHYGGVNDD
jgi:hypothetical protein